MGNTIPAEHTGNGEVYIIPAIEGCGCDYRCLALDPERSNVRCVCPTGWFLANNSRSCKSEYSLSINVVESGLPSFCGSWPSTQKLTWR